MLAFSHFSGIKGDTGILKSALCLHILLVHARIPVVRLHIRIRQLWCLLPYLHVPYGGHMAVLLCVGDGDAQVASLCFLAVNHRRALHGVGCTVGINRPFLAIYRGLYHILIEECGIFKLYPYLAEFGGFPEVYLQPFVVFPSIPVGAACLPQRAVIVVNGIFGLEPVVIITAGCYLGPKGKVLVGL